MKKFTAKMKCDHCGNVAPMEILHAYSQTHTEEEVIGDGDDTEVLTWDEGWTYRMLVCQGCDGVVLDRIYFNERYSPEGDYPMATLYPQIETMASVLPSGVKKEYEAALQVRRINANAYAVLLGRVLEKVGADRSASGNSLSEKLTDLAAKGEIPKTLVEMAHGLRQLRNVGAHADLGDLTGQEIELLDAIVKAILEYVYRGPMLLDQVKRMVSQRKGTGAQP